MLQIRRQLHAVSVGVVAEGLGLPAFPPQMQRATPDQACRRYIKLIDAAVVISAKVLMQHVAFRRGTLLDKHGEKHELMA